MEKKNLPVEIKMLIDGTERGDMHGDAALGCVRSNGDDRIQCFAGGNFTPEDSGLMLNAVIIASRKIFEDIGYDPDEARTQILSIVLSSLMQDVNLKSKLEDDEVWESIEALAKDLDIRL